MRAARAPNAVTSTRKQRSESIEPQNSTSSLQNTQADKEAATLRISGEIVGPKIVQLSRTVEEVVGSQYSSITVDLRDVPYIDSYGLGGLVYCHKQLEKANKHLLIMVSPALLDLFAKCRLEKVLHLVVEEPSTDSTS